MNVSKRIVVVGAGISGLLAIKALKEEGFYPICFEKTSRLGGMWHYHEDDTKGIPSIPWFTSFNNSKEPGAISDFPASPDTPNFMTHQEVIKMLQEYSSTFNLAPYINYNTEVIKISRSDDFEEDGKWKITVKNVDTGDIEEDLYEGVLVCSGHSSIENIPDFPGIKMFKGEVIHTHSIKKILNFDNKVVFVVGTGSSAFDIAEEISHVAKKVYLSIRTPCWILPRLGPHGYPLDWSIFNYYHRLYQKILPRSLISKIAQKVYINRRFSHSLFNIFPKRDLIDGHPQINESLPSRIMNGTVILKKNLMHFTETGVTFEDDCNRVTEVDTVVFGTGYKWEFPFISCDDLVTEENKVYLYKCVFPPHLSHPTMGIIGFIVPMGPTIPCIEMQCRWAARVIKRKCQLPSQNVMMKDINRHFKENLKRIGNSDKTYIHVDFISYLDDIASKIGVKPNLFSLFLSDFQLFLACSFGTFLPYRYRLTGPHKWQRAREAIFTAGVRMRTPLQGRKAIEQFSKNRLTNKSKYGYIGFVILVFYLWKNNYLTYNMYVIVKRFIIIVYYLAKNMVKDGKLY